MKTITNLKMIRMLFILVGLCLSVTSYAQLKIHPYLSSIQGCQYAYTLEARESGQSTWNSVPLYNILVTNQSGSQVNSTVANFDCGGAVDIKITYDETVTSAMIGPASLNITPAISGNTVTFTIPGPKKFYVNVNGDHYTKCMHIIAQPMEVDPPQPGDPDVVYLAAGTYDTDGITLTDGQTLYIEGGAAVAGVDLANNTKVLGRGFVYRPSYDAFSSYSKDNIYIDGPIGLNHGWGGSGGAGFRCGSSTNVTLKNTAAFSSKKWGDGYNIFSSENVIIDDVFVRTNDDAITFYGGGKSSFTGDCKNVTVTNSVLLPDLAQSFHVGVYGDQYDTEIRDITCSNIEIDDWSRTPGRPVIYFTVGDKVRAANLHFNDIRVNGYMPASFNKSFIGMHVVYNSTYNYAPGREVDSVFYNNVSYTGPNGTPPSSINGYDAGRLVKNVFFEDLIINGATITSASQGNFNIGSYTENIVFNNSSGSISLSATAGDGSVSLNWTRSGITLGKQDVFRDTDPDMNGRTLIAGDIGSGTSYTDNTAQNGTTYWYWIKATDVSGEIINSNAASATPTSLVVGETYVISAAHSGQYMDVANGSTADGASIIQWPYHGGDNQQWVLEDAGSGYYKLKSVRSGKYIDIFGGSTADGADVIQWTSNTGENQQYSIIGQGNGYYTIQPRHSGKCVEVANASTSNGANVRQWTCNGGANQNWSFTLASTGSRIATEMGEDISNGLKIYPNPVSDALYIKNATVGDRVFVYSSSGKLVLKDKIGQDDNEVEMGGIHPGIYFIKVKGNETDAMIKVIKK